MTSVLIEDIVEQAIPIYTLRKPHPVKKRPDCGYTREYKEGLRKLMRKELAQPVTRAQEQLIIAKYQQKTKDL